MVSFGIGCERIALEQTFKVVGISMNTGNTSQVTEGRNAFCILRDCR